ncbi:MAG: A/G-specific adenine glycosylase [Desulfobulbales bacterium]
MNNLPKHLLSWFHKNARNLPWRETYDPYQVWISEIMLQQTQMDRVIDYFTRWIARFPDVKSITEASEEEVLKHWEGLGYYARARNIIKCAKILQKECSGAIPSDYDFLLNLPGIGKYTAGAIMSIAFNKNFPLVDANIERIFARLFNLAKPVKEKETHLYIWQKALDLLPKGKARLYNQALMELGALVCIARNPRCKICPISRDCQTFKLGVTAERPVLKIPPTTIFIEMATGILQRDGKIFIQKRKKHGVWANLWEFPGGRLEPGETPEMALVREYLEETELSVGNLSKIITVQHSYTIYRVTLHCYLCSLMNGSFEPVLHGAQKYLWITPDQLSDFAFPAGHRKLIQHLKDNMNLLQND